jgi:hypothetical protein
LDAGPRAILHLFHAAACLPAYAPFWYFLHIYTTMPSFILSFFTTAYFLVHAPPCVLRLLLRTRCLFFSPACFTDAVSFTYIPVSLFAGTTCIRWFCLFVCWDVVCGYAANAFLPPLLLPLRAMPVRFICAPRLPLVLLYLLYRSVLVLVSFAFVRRLSFCTACTGFPSAAFVARSARLLYVAAWFACILVCHMPAALRSWSAFPSRYALLLYYAVLLVLLPFFLRFLYLPLRAFTVLWFWVLYGLYACAMLRCVIRQIFALSFTFKTWMLYAASSRHGFCACFLSCVILRRSRCRVFAGHFLLVWFSWFVLRCVFAACLPAARHLHAGCFLLLRYWFGSPGCVLIPCVSAVSFSYGSFSPFGLFTTACRLLFLYFLSCLFLLGSRFLCFSFSLSVLLTLRSTTDSPFYFFPTTLVRVRLPPAWTCACCPPAVACHHPCLPAHGCLPFFLFYCCSGRFLPVCRCRVCISPAATVPACTVLCYLLLRLFHPLLRFLDCTPVHSILFVLPHSHTAFLLFCAGMSRGLRATPTAPPAIRCCRWILPSFLGRLRVAIWAGCRQAVTLCAALASPANSGLFAGFFRCNAGLRRIDGLPACYSARRDAFAAVSACCRRRCAGAVLTTPAFSCAYAPPPPGMRS